MGIFSTLWATLASLKKKEEEPEPEPEPESEHICAITFLLDKNRDIHAECEWTEDSSWEFAQLISTVNSASILPDLLAIIKESCVEHGAIEEYTQILGYVHMLMSMDLDENHSSENPLVKPTQVINTDDNTMPNI